MWSFNHLVGLHTGSNRDHMHICAIDPELSRAIGSRSNLVMLSHYTIQKQIRRHPEVQLDHYRVLRPAVALGEWWQDTDHCAVVLFVDTVLYDTNFRVAVKSTSDGNELFVSSFHLLRDKKLNRERRKARPLIRRHYTLKRGP